MNMESKNYKPRFWNKTRKENKSPTILQLPFRLTGALLEAVILAVQVHDAVLQDELPLGTGTVNLLELTNNNVITLEQSFQVFFVTLIVVGIQRFLVISLKNKNDEERNHHLIIFKANK